MTSRSRRAPSGPARGSRSRPRPLGSLRLRSLELTGGISDVRLTLRRPRGAVAVCLFGGASNVTMRRPAGVRIELELSGAGADVRLDDQYLYTIDREIVWRSADDENAQRYNIVVSGGASSFTILTR